MAKSISRRDKLVFRTEYRSLRCRILRMVGNYKNPVTFNCLTITKFTMVSWFLCTCNFRDYGHVDVFLEKSDDKSC